MKYVVQELISREGEPFAGHALRASISISTYRTYMKLWGALEMQKVNSPKKIELFWMSLRYSFWGLKIEIFKQLFPLEIL